MSEILARRLISATSLEPLALVVVQRLIAVQLVEVAAAGIRIAGEAAAVAPRFIGLDGDDLGGGGGEQLAVVADVEDRLAGRRQLALEPALAGHIEEVVRFVEQQDVVVAVEQDSRAIRFCSPPENVRNGRSATAG